MGHLSGQGGTTYLTSLNIDPIWARIQKHSRQMFHTIKGIEFSYEAHSGFIQLLNTNRTVPRSNFETALSMWPLQSVVQLRDANIQGPSYVLKAYLTSL
jgi:hypothetical protein